MASTTGIQWTDSTWNPVRGCSRVSEGCRQCYAEGIAARFSGPGKPFEGFAVRRSNGEPHWTGKVELVPERLTDPLRWREPRRVFVNSMSDLFHESLPDFAIDRVFAIMALTPKHTHQVLTKRPQRILDYLSSPVRDRNIASEVDAIMRDIGPKGAMASRILDGTTRMYWGDNPEAASPFKHAIVRVPLPLPNVWLGVSVEDQAAADERIPLLLQTPAAVRFVSAEPLLGPVRLLGHMMSCRRPAQCARCGHGHGFTRCPNYGGVSKPCHLRPDCKCDGFQRTVGDGIDWVIVGGESGKHARPFDVAWARSTVEQCRAAGVACFVKQLGARPFGAQINEHPLGGDPTKLPADTDARRWPRDSHGGDWSEWPEDLRVRESPAVPA